MFTLPLCSAINVSFAVQVLSSTFANVLKNYYDKETNGTAKFCKYIDKFFDCLNVRNKVESVKKWKSKMIFYITY